MNGREARDVSRVYARRGGILFLKDSEMDSSSVDSINPFSDSVTFDEEDMCGILFTNEAER